MPKRTKASRKAQRIALKAMREAARRELDGHTCSVGDCNRLAVVKWDCITCEKQNKTHATYACAQHAEKGQAMARRHALVKHPANIVGAIGAGLKGEL